MRSVIVLYVAFCSLLAGCTVNPQTGQRELSNTGKAALVVVVGEVTDRYVDGSSDGERTVRNIANVAQRLQDVTDAVTITELRARIDVEVAALDLSDLDRRSAQRWLGLLEGVLRDSIGKDDLDADAYIKVGEFVGLILSALPPPPV